MKTASKLVVEQDDEKVIIRKPAGDTITIFLNDNSIVIESVGDLDIKAGGIVRMTGAGGVEISTEGPMNLKSDSTIDISARTSARINATDNLKLNSGLIEIN